MNKDCSVIEQLKHAKTVTINLSSSRKRSLSNERPTINKQNKKSSTFDDEHGMHEENLTTSLTTNSVVSSESKLGKNIVPSKNELVWNAKWLEFKETPKLQEFKIDNESTIYWCPDFMSKEEANALFTHLMEELNFEHSTISMYGKSIHVPRLQSWFANDGLVVKDLFQKQKQHVWTEPMRKLKDQLDKQFGVTFDYCLVNLYRNGDDYINFHADNETRDTIASVSLGATRKFIVRHLSCFNKIRTRNRKPLTKPTKIEYHFSLTDGSLVVMSGSVQQYWKHAVPKEKHLTQPRINLTFRVQSKK